MFCQIRMNRWRRDASPEAVRAAIAALAELPSQIEGIRRWEQSERLPEDREDFDFVLSIGFDDRDTYELYLEHPAHVRVVTELVRPNLEASVRIRFETED